MTDEEAHAQLLEQLRSRLAVLATDHATALRETEDSAGWYSPGTSLVLEPAAPGATRVVVFPEDAYTTWVEFGRDVRVEIATDPGQVPQAVESVLAVVEAIVAGRVRYRLWYARSGSRLLGREAWLQLAVDGPWVRSHTDGQVPGRLTRHRYRAEDVDHTPFS